MGANTNIRRVARFFGLTAASLLLCVSAQGASRSGTTIVGVRVERHAGVLVPAPVSGLVLVAAQTEIPSPRPTAIGNESPRLSVSSTGTSERVSLTVFEP